MKVVILAGGFGTRISELTSDIPKPMIKINNIPILVHILNNFSHYNFNEFIICCGYKGEIIKKYFLDDFVTSQDIHLNFSEHKIEILSKNVKKWKITLVNTGLKTNTAGRLKKIKKYLGEDKNFFMTYGDGLSNVNVKKLLIKHNANKNDVTVTVAQLSDQFGLMKLLGHKVIEFSEKPKSNRYINAGFFVISTKIIDLIKNSNTSWEKDCLPIIAKNKKLGAFQHSGFWHSMDSISDKIKLEKMSQKNPPPWKNFK